MKILIATDSYKYNMSGVTASVLALRSGLTELGHEVKILSLSNTVKSFREEDDYYIKSVPALCYPGIRMSFAMHDPLIKEIEEWKPDLIHVQSEGSVYQMALRIKKHCDIPLVMTCHTDYAHFAFGGLKSTRPVKAVMRTAGKHFYQRATLVTVPSQKAKNFSLLDTQRDRITVVPNGIELDRFNQRLTAHERHELRTSLGIDDHTAVLLIVSRLSKEKNIREVINFFPRLLEKLPDTKLLIVGDGPDKKHLEKLTKKLQLEDRIIFTGRVPSDSVWRYYDAGDVFVSASTFEVHSISYLEALSNGLPMLCRKDDALIGVLEQGENGLIYDSQDEFTDYAYKLLSDYGLRARMGSNSKRRSERFSKDSFASAMFEVYEDAVRTCNGEDALEITHKSAPDKLTYDYDRKYDIKTES